MISNKESNGKMTSDGPFVLGLTGGIGTGKSTAASYISKQGFEHIDADAIGRELTEKGSPVLDMIREEFGRDGIIGPDGTLDRKALARIVFSDPEEKKKLDRIMFGQISRVIMDRIASSKGPVLLDAPLLFESGLDKICHHVILITCDMEKRLERVISRDGVRREDVIARINNQMSDSEKAELADHIIDNSGDPEDLYGQIEELLRQLLTKED